MKYILVILVLCAVLVSAASAGTAITYQGRLANAAGAPLTGTYIVSFQLYDVSSGGTPLAIDTHSVTAEKGLFTTSLSFDPSFYDGRDLWLGITVGSDPEMVPRQELRPVPYALGLVPGAQIIRNSATEAALSVSNSMSTGISVTGMVPIIARSSGQTGVYGDAAADEGWGVFGVTTGNDGAGVYGVAYAPSSSGVLGESAEGAGVSGYGRTGGHFATNQAGTPVSGSPSGVNISTAFDYNTGMRIDATGTQSDALVVFVTGDDGMGMLLSTDGNSCPGIFANTFKDNSFGVHASTWGTNSPALSAATLSSESVAVKAFTQGPKSPAVRGESTLDVGIYGIGNEGGYFTTNQPGMSGNKLAGVNVSTGFEYNPGVIIETSGSNSDGMQVSARGDSSIGIALDTTGSYSHGVYAFVRGMNSAGVKAVTSGPASDGILVFSYGAGSRGVSAYSDQSEGVVGEGVNAAGVKGESATKAGLWGVSDEDVGLYAVTNRADDKYGIYTPDYLYAKGAQVPAADIAEYLPVIEDIEPGTVLVIGADGRLTPSSAAYDTAVAGIVSTAPGVSLGTKEGGNDGETLVALAGRVPCKVDAAYGAIHPGDLLSTSATPGHAMKADNPQIGTILGKALGSLDDGTGVVDVIVTLQ